MFHLFKKKKQHNYPSFFEQLPLSDDQQNSLKTAVKIHINKELSEEKQEELLSLQSGYEEQLIQFKRMEINNFGWELKETPEQPIKVYVDPKTGNSLVLAQKFPGSALSEIDLETEFYLYQDNMRNSVAQIGGGLISSEVYQSAAFRGYESILRLPGPEGQEGSHYLYLLEVHNLVDNTLDQVQLTLQELSPAGLRKKAMLQPLSELFAVPMEAINTAVFNRDPYEADYDGGEGMRDFSELELFDESFPFHPLSLLRQQLRPALLNSIRLLDEIVEDSDFDDEVEYEEL